MEVLDLFSAAAGGWSLGMHRAGFQTVAACESVAWRRALYAQNNPGVILYDDVRTLTAERLRADLGFLPGYVVGSPPCQDISSANTKGRGVEGERSGLYFEAVRIIGEVRPRWFALENSANLRTRGADAVITALEGISYACWPLVVRAGDVGANHERPRAWLIGCDLGQVADANGFGSIGFGGRRVRSDLCVSEDPRDTAQIGRGTGLPRGCVGAAPGAEQSPRGNATYANRDQVRLAIVSGRPDPETPFAGDADKAAHADAAGERPQGQPRRDEQRQDQEPQRTDIPEGREMGLCPPDSGYAVAGGTLWSLADLADHLRLDDGLSVELARTRVDIGDGKGQSAASLIVEAFGDAVVPQIPEAIGRAILRTETALAAVFASESLAA